jgi:hypothetical protein
VVEKIEQVEKIGGLGMKKSALQTFGVSWNSHVL